MLATPLHRISLLSSHRYHAPRSHPCPITTPPPPPQPNPTALNIIPFCQPSFLRRAFFAARDPGKRYLRAHLLVWIAATALMIADRFLWNVWPRQDVFPDVAAGGCGGADGGGCGEDFFCPMDEVWTLSGYNRGWRAVTGRRPRIL